MDALVYEVLLLEPVLAAGLSSGEENSARSLPYLPGSLIRGALMGRTLAARPSDDFAGEVRARRAYFDANTRYLNAYAVDRLGKRGLPTPRSLFVDKNDLMDWKIAIGGRSRGQAQAPSSLDVCDAALDEDAFECLEDARVYASDATCCRLSDGKLEPVKCAFSTTIHIRRQHARKLDTVKDTQVFQYETLKEGQRFAGVILGPRDVLEGHRASLLDRPELHVGGARTGYGRVRVGKVELRTDWREAEEAAASVEDVLTITLLSDLIARDAQGQPVQDPGPLLGLGTATRAYRQFRVHGGFNRKAGLPLSQDLAVAMGSVFVYPALRPAALADKRDAGIGERTEDGYGRFAVNLNGETRLTLQEIGSQEQVSAPALSGQSLGLAQRIVDAQWRKRADLTLLEAAQRALTTVRGKASPSTLSRIRIAARESVFRRDLKPLRNLLDDIDDKGEKRSKPAVKALNDVLLNKEPFFEWLKKRSAPDYQMPPFQMVESDLHKLSIGKATPGWSPQLRAEYHARLIELLVDGMIKRQKVDKEARR